MTFAEIRKSVLNLPHAEFERILAARRKVDDIQARIAALKGGSAATARAGRTRTVTMTPKMRKARKLQGQYLGRLKKLKGVARARVKMTARESGVAEAVKLADKLLG